MSATVGRALLLGAMLPVLALAQETHPYQRGIDVLDYAFSIDLPDSGAVIRGDATLIVRRTARRDTLQLDLRQLHVSRVTLDDRTVQFGRTDSTILVPLPRGDSGTYRLRVVYDGAVTDGLIARTDREGRWTYFGDNWPNRARFWLPTVDHPSDKATVTWLVTAPRGRTVVANGALMDSSTTGSGAGARTRSRWRESKPIATYLMVVGAAPMLRHELGETACGLAEIQRCVPQVVYAAPELRGTLPGNFGKAGEIVRLFASLVGPFPYEKLAHVQSATRFGGMENASAIFYSDGAFRRGGVGEGLIAHETAHQWFGDAVTEREWPHLWLSEGFATYFAALWTRRARGDSAFRSDMARIRSTILADSNAVAKRPVIDTIETTLLRLLNANSYQKGGFVLHMLRSALGDSAFFAGVRDYYARHRHSTALSSDLQAALERASGKSLGSFFNQWLRRPGYPEIDVAWQGDTAANTLTLSVKQSGRFGHFEFPLRLALLGRDGITRRVEFAIPAQELTQVQLPTSERVSDVAVDPDVQLLARITVSAPPTR